MVKLRLQRLGRRNRPFYRIIAIDSRKKRDGEYIELLGTYDPILKVADHREKFSINLERYDFWISKGAQPTETVKRAAEQKKKTEK